MGIPILVRWCPLGHLLPTEISKTSIRITSWISNCIIVKQWYVIIHPCHNFIMKLVYGLVITSQRKLCMWLLTHTLISVKHVSKRCHWGLLHFIYRASPITQLSSRLKVKAHTVLCAHNLSQFPSHFEILHRAWQCTALHKSKISWSLNNWTGCYWETGFSKIWLGSLWDLEGDVILQQSPKSGVILTKMISCP